MVVNKKEIIGLLERACDLFDKIQGRKAVIRANEIVKEASNTNTSSLKQGGMKNRCTTCGKPLDRIEADFCSIGCKIKYNELIHCK